MSLDAPNFQFPTDVLYQSGDRGTGAWAVKPGNVGVPETVLLTEGFEGLTFGVVFVPGGNAPWARSLTTPHTGVGCFKAGTITDNQTSDATVVLATVVPPGANQIRFWYRVSSELNFDFFRVLLDSTVVFSDSGSVPWTQMSIDLGTATTLTFRYSKDSSNSVGEDTAFIDDLQFLIKAIPAVPFKYAPIHLTPADEVIAKVNQGTNPWVSSLDAPTLAALESITVQNPGGASAVNVQDGGNSLTVDQFTNPWISSLAAATATVNTSVGSVSLGTSSGKTTVMKTGSLTTVLIIPDQVILTYTVTAAKTFYMTYFALTGKFTSPPGNPNPQILGAFSLETPAGTKLITLDATSNGLFQIVIPFSEPVPIDAGTVIRVVCTPAATTSMAWKANFGGYEK